MARPLRFQYPGAVYHLMARGDGGKMVFETDDDHLVFLKRLIRQCAPDLGLPAGAAELAHLRKGDERKAMLAALLRKRTTVGFEWIATRLHMGHASSVSRLVCGVKRDRKLEKRVNELDKLLQCTD